MTENATCRLDPYGVDPRTEAASYHHYRCNRQFDELVTWLRGKGIKSRDPLHALRK